jgi:hypothetical protein
MKLRIKKDELVLRLLGGLRFCRALSGKNFSNGAFNCSRLLVFDFANKVFQFSLCKTFAVIRRNQSFFFALKRSAFVLLKAQLTVTS